MADAVTKTEIKCKPKPKQRKCLRTLHWRVHDKSECEILRSSVRTTAHWQNILIILLDANYRAYKEGAEPNLRSLFLNKRVLRAIVSNTLGGKNAEKVQDLCAHFQKHPDEGQQRLFADLIRVGSGLKEKNIAQTVGKLKSAYKGYFTKLKNGDSNARPPKAKKLGLLNSYSIPIDQCAWSFKVKNKIRINVDQKMVSFSLDHDKLRRIVGELDQIQSVEVVLKHEEIFFAISYCAEPPALNKPKLVKLAGMDLGVFNLASVYVDDIETASLTISGERLKTFNSRNNGRIAKAKSKADLARNHLNELLSTHRSDKSQHQTELVTQFPEIEAALSSYKTAQAVVSRLYAKRHKFFKDTMHKAASRILDYLSLHGVTHLYVSRNLGEAKQNQGLSRKFNKNFHPVPIIRLVDYLILKGARYGISVIEIDEAYSSKVSCLLGDVIQAQQIASEFKEDKKERNKRLREADVFKGRRVTRDVFRDVKGQRIDADLNGAANHIIIGSGRRSFGEDLNQHWKLTSAIKIDIDSLFLDCQLVDPHLPLESGGFTRTEFNQLRDVRRASYAAKFLGQNCHVQVCSG